MRIGMRRDAAAVALSLRRLHAEQTDVPAAIGHGSVRSGQVADGFMHARRSRTVSWESRLESCIAEHCKIL